MPSSTWDREIQNALEAARPRSGGDPFYMAVCQVAAVRAEQPALRYGRQYFRPISGNGAQFGMSSFAPGVLAFSRILDDAEIVAVANTDPHALPVALWPSEVVILRRL